MFINHSVLRKPSTVPCSTRPFARTVQYCFLFSIPTSHFHFNSTADTISLPYLVCPPLRVFLFLINLYTLCAMFNRRRFKKHSNLGLISKRQCIYHAYIHTYSNNQLNDKKEKYIYSKRYPRCRRRGRNKNRGGANSPSQKLARTPNHSTRCKVRYTLPNVFSSMRLFFLLIFVIHIFF